MYNEKLELLNNIREYQLNRISVSEKAISEAIESRDNESKSSMGDKYETGRAMIQIEIDNQQKQLNNIKELLSELDKIDATKTNTKVNFGSLITTNFGKFFISIGHGKYEFNSELYYVISLKSPIGQAFLNKKVGDDVKFINIKYQIDKIE